MTNNLSVLVKQRVMSSAEAPHLRAILDCERALRHLSERLERKNCRTEVLFNFVLIEGVEARVATAINYLVSERLVTDKQKWLFGLAFVDFASRDWAFRAWQLTVLHRLKIGLVASATEVCNGEYGRVLLNDVPALVDAASLDIRSRALFAPTFLVTSPANPTPHRRICGFSGREDVERLLSLARRRQLPIWLLDVDNMNSPATAPAPQNLSFFNRHMDFIRELGGPVSHVDRLREVFRFRMHEDGIIDLAFAETVTALRRAGAACVYLGGDTLLAMGSASTIKRGFANTYRLLPVPWAFSGASVEPNGPAEDIFRRLDDGLTAARANPARGTVPLNIGPV